MARPSKQQPREIPAGAPGKTLWSLFKIDWIIPFLFFGTIVVAFLVIMGENPQSIPVYLKYTTVTGYFQQDDLATDDRNFDYTTTNFGLINRAYDKDSELESSDKKSQWQRFEHELVRLNHESDPKTQYKVLYLGRHGEGYHNVAESMYGTHDWDCYWSLEDGNGTLTWADALLTSSGIEQAKKANTFWRSQISSQKIPTPQSYYASPLLRCLATADITFSGLNLPSDRPFVPIIKELIREAIGAHTCDRRSSKTHIHEQYPDWPFEKGFAENDPLWDPELRETNVAMDNRLRQAFDAIFSNDENTYISISSHSGAIGAILRVIEHREFALGTGQVIPVLVKAEWVEGEGPSREKGPYTKVDRCDRPAATPKLYK